MAEVRKQAHESCNATSPPLHPQESPSPRPGDHFYICSFTGRCSAGQKFAINVNGSSDSAPMPPPSTATRSPPISNVPVSPSPDGSSAPLSYPRQRQLGTIHGRSWPLHHILVSCRSIIHAVDNYSEKYFYHLFIIP